MRRLNPVPPTCPNGIDTEHIPPSQERRRVEEQYVTSLRKLLVFKVPNAASELGFVAQPLPLPSELPG